MKSNKIQTLLASVMVMGLGVAGMAQVSAADQGQYDSKIQQQVVKSLQHAKLNNVQASVADGVVTLQGTVDTVSARLKAEKIAHKAHVTNVQDKIEVAGAQLSDAQIEQKLGRKLAYDRVGYGVAFNALTLQVRDGVATVGGEVRTPMDKDSALFLAENQAGVKNVVDEIRVAPVSILDDQIRLRVARAVYGAPQLQKYAIDPQKPIRIVVDNGHVILAGTVINKMDKQIAGMRAGLVPDVFSIDNQLIVTGGKTSVQSGM